MIKAERWAPLLQLLKDPAVELSFRDRKYLSEAPVIEGKLPMFVLYVVQRRARGDSASLLAALSG